MMMLMFLFGVVQLLLIKPTMRMHALCAFKNSDDKLHEIRLSWYCFYLPSGYSSTDKVNNTLNKIPAYCWYMNDPIYTCVSH